jgi:sodium pump decarboxylase gamma subunit
MNIMELINNFKDPVLIEQLTLGEKISASLFVTALGMLITFTALIVLWGLTAFYSKTVQNAEAKKKANAVVNVKPAAPAPVVTAVEPEEDEEELVAVISAAIAAQLGTSMHNIVVRNIVRVSDETPAWGQSGRFEQMNSRM